MLNTETLLFSRALDQAPVAAIMLSLEGKVLWANAAFCHLTGYAATEIRMLNPLAFCQGPATDPEAVRQIEDALARREVFDVEILSYHVSGMPYWVRAQSQLLCSSEGNPTGFVCFLTNITEAKRQHDLAALRLQWLEAAAQGVRLADLLSRLALGVEALLPQCTVCIQCLDADDRHLCLVAAPSLPPAYVEAIEGTVLGEEAGSAGLAMGRAAPVVADMATAPCWKKYRGLLLPLGYTSSRSHLIISGGQVLGCFDLYQRSVGDLNAADDAVLQIALQVAAAAVLRERGKDKVRIASRALKQANLALTILDRREHIIDVNDCFETQTGYRRDDVIGQHMSVLSGSDNARAIWSRWREALLASNGFEGECTLVRKNGSRYVANVISSVLRNGQGDVTHYISVQQDISEQKSSEAMLHKMAFFDAMTGLPNRRLLLDRLEMVLASGRRHRRVSALIFIDIDQFKRVNDVFGHSVGDEALRVLAKRLQSVVRSQDTVARLGGDEFVVLLPEVGSGISSDVSRSVRRIADKLLEVVRQPFELNRHQHHLRASMGITLLPKGLETAEDLLREADIALYRSKAEGRGDVTFFESGMQLQVQEYAELERDLRQAFVHGELYIFIQPQVDRDGRTVAAEALTRWCHPSRGFIPPVQFIPIAEESGLIVELGEWIFTEVCKLSVRLSAAGRALPISINVSLRQFQHTDFVKRISAILQHTGANPENLVLEVTESLLSDNMDDVLSAMYALSALGLQFSIDDFGTGYSNLARLKQMPLRELKIDKSFVQDLAAGTNDAAIVAAILGIAKSLQLSVVAEGVETWEQADFLLQSGCDRLQGYLYAKPGPAEVFLRDWLACDTTPAYLSANSKVN